MTETSTEFIKTFYFDDLDAFHPAQTFTQDTAYFGVNLEKDVVTKGETRRQPVLAILTSRREIFVAEHSALQERGLRYPGAKFPIPPEPRFRASTIGDWVHGQAEGPDPARLYGDIRDSFQTRVDYGDDSVYDVNALFTFATYVYRLFATMPYLVFHGSKASGKTKTLKIHGELDFNAVEATALTGGALYLEVEGHGSTLLLDDAEDLGDEEARAVKAFLNVGYKLGGSTIRGNWDSQSAQRYSVYSPKVITTIKGVNATTATRCIEIEMQPSLDAVIAASGEDVGSPDWADKRDRLYMWALEHWQQVRESYRTTSRESAGVEISGRSWELWRPMFALARYFEDAGVEGVVERIKTFADQSTKRVQQDEGDSHEGIVLSYLLRQPGDPIEITPKGACADLEADGDMMRNTTFGWILKRLGFSGYKSRGTASGGRRYSIPRDKVEDAAARRGLGVERQAGQNRQDSQGNADESDVADGPDEVAPTPETELTSGATAVAQVRLGEGAFGSLTTCSRCPEQRHTYFRDPSGDPICPTCKAQLEAVPA